MRGLVAAILVITLAIMILVDRVRFKPRDFKPLQRTLIDARYPLLRMGLTAICDPRTGNLIYLHREGRQTSMAVVPGGCEDVIMGLEAD